MISSDPQSRHFPESRPGSFLEEPAVNGIISRCCPSPVVWGLNFTRRFIVDPLAKPALRFHSDMKEARLKRARERLVKTFEAQRVADARRLEYEAYAASEAHRVGRLRQKALEERVPGLGKMQGGAARHAPPPLTTPGRPSASLGTAVIDIGAMDVDEAAALAARHLAVHGVGLDEIVADHPLTLERRLASLGILVGPGVAAVVLGIAHSTTSSRREKVHPGQLANDWPATRPSNRTARRKAQLPSPVRTRAHLVPHQRATSLDRLPTTPAACKPTSNAAPPGEHQRERNASAVPASTATGRARGSPATRNRLILSPPSAGLSPTGSSVALANSSGSQSSRGSRASLDRDRYRGYRDTAASRERQAAAVASANKKPWAIRSAGAT